MKVEEDKSDRLMVSRDNRPSIEAVTERPLLVAGREQNIDLLMRITAPEVGGSKARPHLNIGVVLDRSGSMQGEKMAHARRAAAYCVDQLMADDRISVIIFDNVVETIVPSRLAEAKEAIKERITSIRARNSTALHEAWVKGGIEVSEHLREGAINRVLLITDGLANVGETNVDTIVSQAAEVATRGVSTSTIGIGADFNEDLLIPMAEAGGGNAWHVREPGEMERIFATELKGLIAQVGHTVSLGLTPGDGVKVRDVLNDFEVTHTGRYKLPNLLAGASLDVVARLQVPAMAAGRRHKILDLRLAWNPQGAPGSDRQTLGSSVTVEYADAADVERHPGDERVTKAVQFLMAARARREAIRQLDSGDIVAARATVAGTAQLMADACAAYSDDLELRGQLMDLNELEQELAREGDLKTSRKKLSYQAYNLARQSKRG